MNSFNFTGGLGGDCEVRYTQSGDPIGSFSVAVTSGYGDKEVTTWVNCSLWGKRAVSLDPYLRKGQQVAISGELTNRKWTDKSGQDKYNLEVRVIDLTLIGGKKDSESVNTQRQDAPSNDNSFNPDDDAPW